MLKSLAWHLRGRHSDPDPIVSAGITLGWKMYKVVPAVIDRVTKLQPSVDRRAVRRAAWLLFPAVVEQAICLEGGPGAPVDRLLRGYRRALAREARAASLGHSALDRYADDYNAACERLRFIVAGPQRGDREQAVLFQGAVADALLRGGLPGETRNEALIVQMSGLLAYSFLAACGSVEKVWSSVGYGSNSTAYAAELASLRTNG